MPGTGHFKNVFLSVSGISGKAKEDAFSWFSRNPFIVNGIAVQKTVVFVIFYFTQVMGPGRDCHCVRSQWLGVRVVVPGAFLL